MKAIVWRWFRVVWASLGILFIVWNWYSFQAKDVPQETLVSTRHIQVLDGDERLTFQAEFSEKTEVIFFPGGLVDPQAYAPLARRLAEQGYTTHIIKMPWRLANLGYERINQLFDFRAEEKQYVLGGHSQGAKVAAQFVYEQPGKVRGLFLLGTSHPRDISLAQVKIPVLKLYAENDGLASVAEVLGNKEKLPEHTKWGLIPGGNHAQFGHLGTLLMDEKATISRAKQQDLVFTQLLSFLKQCTP